MNPKTRPQTGRPPGRPQLLADRTTVAFCVERATFERVQALASAEHRTVSAYLRLWLDEALEGLEARERRTTSAKRASA